MERCGIRTGRGDINRENEVTNANLRQLKTRLVKLQSWLKERKCKTPSRPPLPTIFKKILSRKAQAANNYLKGVMNGKTTLPAKTWRVERVKLTADRNRLNGEYVSLKDGVKEAEQIRKSIYSILRQEQRERQPRRAQDMEL